MELGNTVAAAWAARWLAFVRTRRGIVATGLALVVVDVLDGGFGLSAASAVVVLPLAWVAAWVLVAAGAALWDARTHPERPSFARRAPEPGGGPVLRRDTNATFWKDRGGFLWARRYWFVGTGCAPVRFSPADYTGLKARHAEAAAPVPVAQSEARSWWWWQGAFYWETGGYGALDVKALLFKRERRKQRELEHAHSLLATEDPAGAPRKRAPIAENVKHMVFRRDAGSCRECGSTELLQFDHVIPFSMGGSDEPENLQLLCAPCNREKGGRL
ncbi:MAG: HNH endonuclease [Solirubrobacterales bacterium]